MVIGLMNNSQIITNNDIDAILLMGPTATGKTNLALKLAEVYPIEIISVDSVLVYKGMNIGSAKPNKAELAQVPHHLIDIIEPDKAYSVATFIRDSINLIAQIKQRGKIPVLVGGTMMYYNGLLHGISILPESSPEIRHQLEQEITTHGITVLHKQLLDYDPIAYNRIMPNDKQRIMRAVEVYRQTGVALTKLQQDNKLNLTTGINFLPISIVPDNRKLLHTRINSRLIQMISGGFIDEVESLRRDYPHLTPNHTSMRSVGYAQVWQYLDGAIDTTQLIEMASAATRQLAKRQLTWIRAIENKIILDDEKLDINNLFTQLLSIIKLVKFR